MQTRKHLTRTSERDAMLRALRFTVADLKRYIKADPKEYTEPGCDEPTIDIRLCVDPDGWIFRTGLSDYDPYHSELCGASCVSLDTEPESLLDDLIEQCLEQYAERS